MIWADDIESYNLSRHFDKMLEFINKNLKTTNVLVHCFAGVSRSATTVIAYLMKFHNMSFSKAFDLCRIKRRIINPNNGFVRQLYNFERQLI